MEFALTMPRLYPLDENDMDLVASLERHLASVEEQILLAQQKKSQTE